jgi:peptide-methionine (R)-S-oxide reductase
MKARTSKLSGTSCVFGSDALRHRPDLDITQTEAEWHAMLTDTEYQMMRDEKTECSGSGPLDHEKRAGIFGNRGCGLPFYDVSTKFDIAMGWPSTFAALPTAVEAKDDNSFFLDRTRVHYRRCRHHLGYVSDDGPKPTGKRHCQNGVNLGFQGAEIEIGISNLASL